jgi:predicted Ser/Thr protein kinase
MLELPRSDYSNENTDAQMEAPLSRASVQPCVVGSVHTGRSVLQADIMLVEYGGKRYALKDFRLRPRVVRWLFGRCVIAREFRIMKQLEGIEGIPQVVGMVDGDGFLMEYVEGHRLPRLKENDLVPVFFERLEHLMRAMHARGVGHGDLRRKNVLVTREFHPYLVDFATAFRVRGLGNVVSRWILARYRRIDEATLLKLKRHFMPQHVTPEEVSRLGERPWYLHVGRFLRKRVYRELVKPRRWKKRWQRWKERILGRAKE